MLVPSSRESRQTFQAASAEEVLRYATRPLGDALDVVGGERTTTFGCMDAGRPCILDHDQQSPGKPRVFLRLLSPVCRTQQISAGTAWFNVVGLKTIGFCSVSDDRRVYVVPYRHNLDVAHTRETAPGDFCLFGDLAPGARIRLLQRDGIPVQRSECFVKLSFLVVPAVTDCQGDETFTALIPATGELAVLPQDTPVIRLG